MSMTTSPVLWARKDLNLRLPRYQRGTLNNLSYLPIKYNSNQTFNILCNQDSITNHIVKDLNLVLGTGFEPVSHA